MSDLLDRAPPSIRGNANRLYWAKVFVASDLYTNIPQFYTEDAELTATLATKTMMAGCRGKTRLPPLGDLVDLTSPRGTFVSVDYALPDGNLEREDGRRRGDARKLGLWWSPSARALVVLPQVRVGACNAPPTHVGSRVLRTWTQGRRAGRCSAGLPALPKSPLPDCYPGICVTYVSDKFSTTGKLTKYVHHFDSAGVRVWMSRSLTPVILIQGGRLRIEEHGIAG